MTEQTTKKADDKKKEAESLLILGIFSIVVGAVLFLAIIFTDTNSGRLANFLVGLVLFILGISIYLKSKGLTKRALKNRENA